MVLQKELINKPNFKLIMPKLTAMLRPNSGIKTTWGAFQKSELDSQTMAGPDILAMK